MYFADVFLANNFNIYKGLLDQYLQKPDSSTVKELFQNIIKTAHLLSTNAIAENQIDNTIYNLVISLVDLNRLYFQKVDPNNIGEQQFRTLSGILSSLIFADQEYA